MQRTATACMLTDAGREVLALAERIEAAITDCETTLEMMAGQHRGPRRRSARSRRRNISCRSSIAAISQSSTRTSTSRSRSATARRSGEALRGYDLDFAIMGRPPADIDVNVHLIGDHPHVIIAPTSHRLARKIPHRAERSRQRDLPDPRARIGHAQADGAIVRDVRHSTPKIGMEMSSNETIKQAVIAGLGIAFISAHTVAQRARRTAGSSRSTSTGLPIVRQWFALRRKRQGAAAAGAGDARFPQRQGQAVPAAHRGTIATDPDIGAGWARMR